jgi:hypothetical protein
MEVHDHNIWLQLQTERTARPPSPRSPTTSKTRCSQRRPETVSVKGVIIGDQYA